VTCHCFALSPSIIIIIIIDGSVAQIWFVRGVTVRRQQYRKVQLRCGGHIKNNLK